MIEKLKPSHKMSYVETVEKINELIDVVNASEGHCKDCNWWDTKSDNYHHRFCLNERINSGDMISDEAVGEYAISEGEVKTQMITWRLFGCVLFEVKK